MGCWGVVILTVASQQSVLCSDSPVFQCSFLNHKICIRRRKLWCLRLIVCHFHTELLLFNYAKVKTVVHSVAPLNIFFPIHHFNLQRKTKNLVWLTSLKSVNSLMVSN